MMQAMSIGKKILIVDDSALIRRLLGSAVGSDSRLEVVYAAPTAELALKYLRGHAVDLVLLDVEMPEMDGIEAVTQIRREWAELPVVMCSSLTELGAEVTLRALQRGASDYIPKPSASFPLEEFTHALLHKIHTLLAPRGLMAERSVALPRRPRAWHNTVAAIAVGCSTGGPNALATLFTGLHRPIGVPLFVVQHMPPLFTRLLAERLGAESGRRVKEGEHHETVESDVVYIAPGGRHMAVVRDGLYVRIELNDAPPEHSCRPAVDVLFRSLAKVYGDRVLAAVLTGMGYDGTDGARCLHESGSRVLVQDATSCVVPSMPSSVANAGWSDTILTVPQIAAEFDRLTHIGSDARATVARSVGDHR